MSRLFRRGSEDQGLSEGVIAPNTQSADAAAAAQITPSARRGGFLSSPFRRGSVQSTGSAANAEPVSAGFLETSATSTNPSLAPPFSGPPTGQRFFPRSLTTDAPALAAHAPAGPILRRPSAQAHQSRAPRSVTYHPGAGDTSGLDYASEGEATRALNAGSSGFHLEGRSYRFQPGMADGGLYGRSYTATQNTIRDSTAQLAGMALMSDDEGSNASQSRIEERDEPESGAATPPDANLACDSLQIGPQSFKPSSFASNTSQQRGPSNLSRALDLNGGSAAAVDIPSASNESTPVAGARSPNVTVDSQGPTDDTTPRAGLALADLEAGEATPLLRANGSASKARARQSAYGAASSAKSRGWSRSDARSAQSMGASAISVPGIHGEHGAEDAHAGESGFSVRSWRGAQSAGHDMSQSVYGSGVLAAAMAEAAAEEAHGRARTPVAPDASYTSQGHALAVGSSETNQWSQQALPPWWRLLPTGLRPGKGTRKVKDISNPLNHLRDAFESLKKLTWRDVGNASVEPVRLLPAVILGLLLNVLDGVSYGLIIFPNSYPIFSDFGGDGVSMFFVTCVISQLVYSLGGSIFRGGNGSMMIEVVPFFHILVQGIINELGDEDAAAVISTTIVSFALSSIFAGVVFLLLGYFRLGVLIGFFPRHILVGCIGGVGVFLIETGMEVAGQLKSEGGFNWDLPTFQYFTQSWDMVAHWAPALGLAILLRLITARFHHPLIFPAYFLVLPVLFYAFVVGAGRQTLPFLRDHGWVFDIGDAGNTPFWRFYTYFDFRKTSLTALWSTMPTQLALTFFSILHVPLNVPALAVSVGEDNLDTDRELVAHGVSNILAGLLGSVPNYLCYVNSVLFYRVGGGSRLSGVMLAAGTAGILIAGPGAISYLPIVVVGALIFVLGIDLVKEALWDTIGRVNRWEYFTIVAIIAVMTYYDFVVGILVGIILACCFFVIQTSKRRVIRAVLDGSIARSTVRRHATQRHFLDAVGSQTQIVKLQGFLYFANISSVEELMRRALDIAAWQRNPIRFLIVDFSLVSGIDFSAAEAFTRVSRLLDAKDVVLVFCGLAPDSDVGDALRAVDIHEGVRLEIFQHLNEALEWTENQFLRSMYASGLAAGKQFTQASVAAGDGLDMPDKKRKPAFVLDEAFENSPRRHHLQEAAIEAAKGTSDAMAAVRAAAGVEEGGTNPSTSAAAPSTPAEVAIQAPPVPRVQPLPLLMATFQAYRDPQAGEKIFMELAKSFEPLHLSAGETLWERGDESDAMYLIQAGILKARYDFQEGYEINEAMLAGTIAGEMTFLAREPRNTTAFADSDCTLWRMDRRSLSEMENGSAKTFSIFIRMLLRASNEESAGLMSYLVSRLS
ncbi:hypothetical protein IE81DRAFT_310490 [Ceraceosorus guamensis]|uniref:Sulfate transporter family protein n=1 Tax=Ceraceosorus guamensis TaxID=1522189 RepID=A0A316W762_9BASI|nr:hypothetical protein IE81DRAFT_310490 [Ceraceosorus guamensis]PWN44571.1 hypothetical protein IE81DRAFT_310490 [Ceraceosorus guamensis]